jgi:hypothetical protein
VPAHRDHARAHVCGCASVDDRHEVHGRGTVNRHVGRREAIDACVHWLRDVRPVITCDEDVVGRSRLHLRDIFLRVGGRDVGDSNGLVERRDVFVYRGIVGRGRDVRLDGRVFA